MQSPPTQQQQQQQQLLPQQQQQSLQHLDQCGLTQAGLEEYNIRASSYYDQTTFHHQKQGSYAQSEGYHSYVSSSDSTSATPFLDKLRQESELLSRQSHHWSENDLSSVCSNSVAPSPIPLLARQCSSGNISNANGSAHQHTHAQHHSSASNHSPSNNNNNNNNNSSESTSSTETLKWLGSMSDISEASHVTGYSAIAESVSSSQLIVHSSRVLTPKRHQSESVLYLHDNEVTSPLPPPPQPPTKPGSSSAVNNVKQSSPISEDVVQPLRFQHRHSPSYPPVHTSMALHRFQQQQPQSYKLTAQSSLPELESPPAHEARSLLGQSQSTGDLQQPAQLLRPAQQHKSSISVTISSSEAVVTIAPQPPPSKPQLNKLELHSCSAPNVASSSSGGSAEQSPPAFINDSYRSNHRLFPVSTYTEPLHSNTSQYVQHPKPQFSANLHKSAKLPVITPAGAAVQPAWHSVAERINDFERSQLVDSPKFSYLEPSKTHRLSNPALKALQKNAVQSYVERQQQQAHKEEQQLLRSQSHSHSYQALHVERKSLPNNLSPMLSGMSNSGSGSASGSNSGSGSGCSSPTPPPPPPRSRSLLPNLLRRSSSASDYADFREQHQQHHHHHQQQQLQSKPPSIRNISSAEKLSFNDCGMPPPPPPPRGRVAMPARRTSSATEYAPMREKLLLQQAAALAHQQHHPQQHRSVHIYQTAVQAPERPPERPPKHPQLRVPSPELPPPPLGAELDNSYTFDEPLPPPPPPEVLQPRPPPSPNRRNSFAGASTRRSAYTQPTLAPKVPPQVPKKPTSLRQQLPHKPQQQQALSNGGNVKPTNLPTSRKRPHNPPPILESVVSTASAAPPPLLPRARPTLADSVIASNLESNQQKRSNSKASYLPRQSLEKLNNTDPDHGIYKLTLTSNEDLVAHNKPSYAVGAGKLKLPNNLPDVLPLGVKLQQQPVKPPPPPSSPGDVVALRYGSNNNLATKSPTNATPTAAGVGNNTAYAMIYGQSPQQPQPQQQQQQQQQQRYSSPALGHAYSKSRSPAPQFTRSQSYDVKQQQPAHDPTQFVSQSHVDLKQAVHDLETTLEEVSLPDTPPLLSPANSDCSLSNSSLECSPENVKNNLNGNPEAHIFRAELISTTTTATLPKQPPPPLPPVNRQESLRENIEKITQLQSQLMSAHLCDSAGLLGSYAKPLSPSSTEPPPTTEPPPSPPPNQEQLAELETESKPGSPMVANTDSLKLMQRSELVLIVNPTPNTADMACQTEDLLDNELVATREEQQTRTTLQPRQRQAIELEYENLALELIKQLAPNDKLIEILTPKSYKPTTQYVNNLYNPNVQLRPAKRDVGTTTLMRMKGASGTTTLLATAELQVVSVELQLADDTGDADSTNLIKQKLDELIKQLNQKIGALKREQQTIVDECAINDQLGLDLLAKLTEKVRPSEASKFRTYIDDVGNITSLLLSLSERLAQTECSLEVRVPSSQQEKSTLEAKRARLYEQLEEAQRLKADFDRRGSSIAKLFGKHLSADLCADYDYFINMKAKLIADARDLSDRIKASEEQLGALSDALVQSDC
ncbi:protein Shroom isoform X2 [Drosophila virilis]